MYKSLPLEKRNDILKHLYMHPFLFDNMEYIGSLDDAGLLSINQEAFSSQLLVAVNRLSSDEAGVESVRC